MTDDPAAARTAPNPDAAPLDRISVRDLLREVEIGAFRSERGVTQRLRFNVTLEVREAGLDGSDQVDRVISYDNLVEAIDDTLAGERLNLLETCAEKIAARALADPRAARVVVRVEKLDRVPGALGVEITRARTRTGAGMAAASPASAGGGAPRVVLLDDSGATPGIVLPGAAPDGPLGAARRAALRDALAAHGAAVVIVVAPGRFGAGAGEACAALSLSPLARARLALLALDQAAWGFADGDPRFLVVETRTELQHALRIGKPAVWAPGRLLADLPAASRPDAGDIAAVAAFLARQIGADAPG